MILVADSAIRLRVKDWMIFHRGWTLVLHEKNNLQTVVFLLLDNIDRDKQLNTPDSREFPAAINLSQMFLKL
jgi:hypothetical protein